MVGPIFVRELLTTPRRPRHFLQRGIYAGLLFILLWTAWQSIFGMQIGQHASDFPSFHALIFPILAFFQVALVLFAASLFGATTISYEKEKRTFILLLMTRLGDAEIVVDKFLCGLLHLATAAGVTLPVFCILALYGGVSFEQILGVYAVTLGTALAANAFGVLIALWRHSTFQSVALSLLALSFYLLLVEAGSALPSVTGMAEPAVRQLQATLSPFRALAGVVDGSELATAGFGGTSAARFLVLAAVAAAALLGLAAWKLRVWNPKGEPLQKRETLAESAGLLIGASARADAETEKEIAAAAASSSTLSAIAAKRTFAGDAKQVADAAHSPHTHRVHTRRVWVNPVLWREVMTRAYGARPILIKLGYFSIFAGLVSGLFTLQPDNYLELAALLAPLAVLSLLLVNAQAVTSVTTERDLASMDLLLATDLTPEEFVYGKLGGALWNSLEAVLGPLALLLTIVALGLADGWTLLFVGVPYLVMVAFSSVLGIHAAMRYPTSNQALANSLGTIFLLFAGMFLCLNLIQLGAGRFEAQWLSFLVFIVMGSIGLWVSLSANAPSNAIALTSFVAPFATFYCIIAFVQQDRMGPFLVATGVYAFAVASLLVPLIHEFDVATGRTSFEEG